MIDALGFKGIWKRTPDDPTAALRTLHGATAVAQGVSQYLLTGLLPQIGATVQGNAAASLGRMAIGYGCDCHPTAAFGVSNRANRTGQ